MTKEELSEIASTGGGGGGIKSIFVHAKEWFDKSAGNSYFSAQIQIQKNNGDGINLYIPFRYGHGNMYIQVSRGAILRALGVESPWCDFLKETDTTVVMDITTGHKKREVVEWGKAHPYE